MTVSINYSAYEKKIIYSEKKIIINVFVFTRFFFFLHWTRINVMKFIWLLFLFIPQYQ